ncbi:16S rRNA (cytidine(1402)-2'-O)-methyltransferase [Aestuariibacter salexigens]|uniref:16S rRNA (cytidine(1402)-2'-O)-methyltransferase n=1 Tax=Aestuariibacter salexigens TaxID=226010 RepID=UPI00040FF19A|nr:16S rRNA (cytidine(1402)-2'-O)-methyltransferase [Aestuariibacter salexigens]
MLIQGGLYVVATPIGNLDDMTKRAIEVLTHVDVIAAEDTRHSQKLLSHYSISTPLLSLHEHNEQQRSEQLIAKMQQGQSIALISDAGTPLISDPGYQLVNLCTRNNIRVTPIPGPSALITALSAAGLPTDRFIFEGFLPVKSAARDKSLSKLLGESATVVFYESPRRILTTVEAIISELGEDRRLVLAKELTKAFETFFSGTAAQCRDWLAEDDNHQRGEFVLMVGGAPQQLEDLPPDALALLALLKNELALKKAAAIVAQHYGLKKNALYKHALEHL